jgi:hypothetical protein
MGVEELTLQLVYSISLLGTDATVQILPAYRLVILKKEDITSLRVLFDCLGAMRARAPRDSKVVGVRNLPKIGGYFSNLANCDGQQTIADVSSMGQKRMTKPPAIPKSPRYYRYRSPYPAFHEPIGSVISARLPRTDRQEKKVAREHTYIQVLP